MSNEITDEFKKVIKDFVVDIQNTFPEYQLFIKKWWKSVDDFAEITDGDERNQKLAKAEEASIKLLFHFCKKKYPPRFFDILYQNDEIFSEDTEIDTEFLPHIYFKDLWQFDVSEQTRSTIWKYLQLITFSIVGNINDKEAFGDTAKLFEAINNDDFKSKLEETLSNISEMFTKANENNTEGSENNSENTSSFTSEGLPNANDIHSHISGMMEGKLGRLAKEIAEETAHSINMDMNNAGNINDVLSGLLKNPTKLMGLVKSVGDKLDSKMKSGDIKETELMAEASELMNKMKNMKGMGDIQSLLGKLGGGLGGMGGLGGGKLDLNAMEAQLNRNMKLAQTKERMRARVEANKLAKEQEALNAQDPVVPNLPPAMTDEELIEVFKEGDVEKTKTKSTKNKKKAKKVNK